MDPESLRQYLHSLPHVEETVQWGGALVFWIGEKSIGGKIFAIIRLEPSGETPRHRPVLSFAAQPDHFSELLEIDGLIPAPYFARIHWLSLTDWRALSNRDIQALIFAAHARVFAKLPAHTRAVLAMPPAQRKKLIREKKSQQLKKSSARKKPTAAKKKPPAASRKKSPKLARPKKK